MAKSKPRAYSYVRFSSPEQREGDSLRRQTEAARAYADRHDLELSEESFEDLGLSAFRGRNIVEGSLGVFIEAVKSGRIKPGSVLLVESIDRLSRQRIMAALGRFSDILGLGVDIVTLTDGRRYTAESLDNLGDLMLFLVEAARSHSESKMKSERNSAKWRERQRKASEGQIVTSKGPGWLTVKGDKFVEIPKRVKIVRRIFAMSANGHGHAYIARELNADGIKPFGRGDGWHRGIVSKILSNKATLGIYQPMRWDHKSDGRKVRVEVGEEIAGYYPQVIEPELFYSIRHAPSRPSGKQGKAPQNMLRDLAVCGRCGKPLHLKNNGYKHGGHYLYCDGRMRWKSCKAPGVRYPETVAEVLAVVRNFQPFDGGSEAAQRDKELAALAGQIEDLEGIVEGLADKIERTESPTLERRLVKRDAELAELKARHKEVEEKQIAANHGTYPPTGEVYNTFEDTGIWSLDLSEKGADDLTAFVRAELRRMVERIEIEKGQPVKVIPREGIELGREPEEIVLASRSKPAST